MTTLKNKHYYWQGLDAKQQVCTGTITAINITQAKLQLVANDITPVKIKYQRSGRKKTLKQQTITQFLQQLASLLNNGIPLVKALNLCHKSQPHLQLKTIIADISQQINAGQAFAKSLARYTKYFNTMLISLVDLGEQTGKLNQILNNIVAQRRYNTQARQKITKALFYPATIVIVAIIISLAMLLLIIPQFEQVFINFGTELPAMTRYTLQLADALTRHSQLVLLLLAATSLLLTLGYRYTTMLRTLLDGLMLTLPISGTLLTLSYQSHFCYLLAMTSSSGLAMPNALDLIANNMSNRHYYQATIAIKQQINQGRSLHDAMVQTKQFNTMACEMVAIGEETGQLIAMLQNINDFYQQQIDHIIDNLGNLLEPCMMIIIGIIIGGLVITMYLPIFNMGNVIS